MAYEDIKGAVNAGQAVVIGIIVIGLTVAIGLYIVNQLDNVSAYQQGNTTVHPLQPAVDLFKNALAPLGGGITFLAIAFIVMVAAVIIKAIQSAMAARA